MPYIPQNPARSVYIPPQKAHYTFYITSIIFTTNPLPPYQGHIPKIPSALSSVFTSSYFPSNKQVFISFIIAFLLIFILYTFFCFFILYTPSMNIFSPKLNSHFACNFVFFCDSVKRLKPAEIWEKKHSFARGTCFNLASMGWGVGYSVLTSLC